MYFPKRFSHNCPLSPHQQLPPARGLAHLPVPQFPRDARQPAALTLLAEGRLQLEEQPQEQQAAGGHGGSGAGAGRAGCCTWARRPPAGMSAWSIIKHPEEGGRGSHLLIQIRLREGGASSPSSAEAGGNLGHGDLNLTVPLGGVWKGTQAQNIRPRRKKREADG